MTKIVVIIVIVVVLLYFAHFCNAVNLLGGTIISMFLFQKRYVSGVAC